MAGCATFVEIPQALYENDVFAALIPYVEEGYDEHDGQQGYYDYKGSALEPFRIAVLAVEFGTVEGSQVAELAVGLFGVQRVIQHQKAAHYGHGLIVAAGIGKQSRFFAQGDPLKPR